MPRYAARAEFRRRTRTARWVLAGVHVGDRFWPAREGVEAMAGRLPDPGLVGWVELDLPILAADAAAAGATALELARARWPDRVADRVPWPAGLADPPG